MTTKDKNENKWGRCNDLLMQDINAIFHEKVKKQTIPKYSFPYFKKLHK